ncbi:NAD-dependent epimerase/dehydratase family protein [Lachnospiraceae bacterium LCP25S3_G4]
MNQEKHVLVTGAGGYIGKFIVKSLLDFGANVTAVDMRTEHIDGRAKILQYDIFNGNQHIYEELGKPDVCLHLAWKDGFVHNSDSHLELLYAHYEFARNMIAGGLKQFAAMGSMHEVGYYEGMITQETPTNPKSMYGIAKNSLRQALAVYQEKSEFVLQWLRAYYIFGDDLHNNSIFTKILKAEEEGKKEFPLNLGNNKYDFIHIENLAKEIALSVMQNKVQGIISCCSGRPVALRDKVEEFIEENHLNIKPAYGVFPERSYDSPIVYGDTEKIKEIVKNAKEDMYIRNQIKEIIEILDV